MSAAEESREARDVRTFLISVAAELAGMHAQTLRTYDRLGLVSPVRSAGGGRRYSERDVELLREIQRLSQDEGVNLAGIKRIIDLTNQVEALQSRVAEISDELSRARPRRDLAVVPKSTAVVVCSMLFLVARYSQLDWLYVLNRTTDTLVGVVAALIVNFLFWPIHRLGEIRALDRQLRRLMASRLTDIHHQLKGSADTTVSPPQGIVGSRLCQQLRQLVNDELRSNPAGDSRRQHWRQRSLLWERINHHSLQLQRLGLLLPQGALASEPTPWLERLPALLEHQGSVVAPLPGRDNLMLVARTKGLQPLLLLAIDDELQRLTRSAQSLALASRRDPAPR